MPIRVMKQYQCNKCFETSFIMPNDSEANFLIERGWVIETKDTFIKILCPSCAANTGEVQQ